MLARLRKNLADSHVPAVAIAVLLFWSLDSALWALWSRVSFALNLLVLARPVISIGDLSRALFASDRVTIFVTFLYLFNSLVYLAAAWILSIWAHGTGPLCSLTKYRTRLTRSRRA